MNKPARHSVGRCIGMSISAAALAAGVVALRHMLETPQPLKSVLPGEARLHVWRRHSIFYKVLGAEDAPPLVLLHTPDIGASAREMQQIMEPLALTHRVYAPDLLGFGLSDRPDLAYSAILYSELCRDFVREVVKQPATLVASGLSCNYAVSAAGDDPALCTGLVLISPLFLCGDAKLPRLVQDYAERPLSKMLLYPLLSTRLAFLLTHAHINRQADFSLFYATTHQLGAEHAAMALVAGKLTSNTARAFERLQQPVLLIWGTRALEDQREIANMHETSRLRRNREVELIQGAGLAVHEEQPESVVAAIQRWLAEKSAKMPDQVREPDLSTTIQQTTSAAPDTARAVHVHRETPQPIQAREPDELTEKIPTEATSQISASPEKQTTVNSAQTTRSILAYCVKCKQKTEMLNASEFTMKNGRLAVRGNCTVCGTNLTRIGGLT